MRVSLRLRLSTLLLRNTEELQTTVQTPSANPTMAIMTSAQSGLKGMGSSTVMAIGAALVVGLLLLTRK